uniref:Uncharacterized protein n=1 Tax=Rhizophora mucronata TaxID=61149 RepID=A0A2P2LP44_RHIMU
MPTIEEDTSPVSQRLHVFCELYRGMNSLGMVASLHRVGPKSLFIYLFSKSPKP